MFYQKVAEGAAQIHSDSESDTLYLSIRVGSLWLCIRRQNHEFVAPNACVCSLHILTYAGEWVTLVGLWDMDTSPSPGRWPSPWWQAPVHQRASVDWRMFIFNNSKNTTVLDNNQANSCRSKVALHVCEVWRQTDEDLTSYGCLF